MRSAVIMSQSSFPSTTPLNATRSRPRRLAPDPLGRGQYENGTKHPLIVCCDGEYNAQRQGASHPLCASLQGLLGLCRLRPVPPCLVDNQKGVLTARQESTLAPQPDPKSGKQYSETALCFGEFFQRSDASLLVICRLGGK